MLSLRNLILLFCVGFQLSAFSQSDSADKRNILNLRSGFGQHSIKCGQHIMFKLDRSNTRFSGRILTMNSDTVFMKNGMRIPVTQFREIGYIGRNEKIIKASGLVMLGLTGVLVNRLITKQDKGYTQIVVVAGMSIGLISYPRRMYKIPEPWILQVSRPLKSPLSY